MKAGLAHRLHIRVFFKNSGGGHIHPLIRALGGKDDRYQQLVRVIVYKLGIRVGGVFLKISNNETVTLLFGHGSLNERPPRFAAHIA